MPLCIHINGGSILDSVEGMQEEDFYLRTIDTIREEIGHQVPILLERFPKSLEIEKRLYQHGVEARLSNIEIWDRRLFALLYPGKE